MISFFVQFGFYPLRIRQNQHLQCKKKIWLAVAREVTREKEQNKNSVEKKGLYLEKDKEKEEELQKEMFSADLTLAFVLVTVLSVPYSFGGWPVQIQRLEEGEFWVPLCVESLLG